MDRADSLSGVAKHLERRVSDYIKTNIHITSSEMLQERLLHPTLDFTGADRVLFSADYPFHRPDATAIEQFFGAISSPGPHQDRLRQRRGPLPPGLIAPAPPATSPSGLAFFRLAGITSLPGRSAR
jgi:hypothetical protein